VTPEKGIRQRNIILPVLALIILAALVIVFDWKEVHPLFGQADWNFTLIALLSTGVSYFVLSASYAQVNRLFGIRLGWRALLGIGFVSATMNNMVTFLGFAGHSLRVVLSTRHDVEPGKIMAASIFHALMHNLMMFILPAAGLTWLVTTRAISGEQALVLSVTAGILIILLVGVTFVMFYTPLRSPLLDIVGKIWHGVVHRDISGFLHDLDNAMSYALKAIRFRRLGLILALVLMAADWVLGVVTLWFCFNALGSVPDFGVMLTGYSVGILAGNIVMLPGGLGVQEAAMAGMYALMGVSFGEAALAAILFRAVYEFVPFFVSLLFYQPLIRGANGSRKI
jgi:uncharacterized protein (TIRG00374 family)